jgi:hypothetical protein
VHDLDAEAGFRGCQDVHGAILPRNGSSVTRILPPCPPIRRSRDSYSNGWPNMQMAQMARINVDISD